MELVATKQFGDVAFQCYQDSNQDSSEQEVRNEFWATREQIGQLLEYGYPREAISKIHERHPERLDKFSKTIRLADMKSQSQADSSFNPHDTMVYSFKGLLEICRFSNQPKADAVMDFLWEVADEIRRTGSYNPQNPVAQTAPATSSLQPQPESLADKMLVAKIVLEVAGLEGNQLALAMDRVGHRLTGYSALKESGIQLIAPDPHQLVTPTQIGEMLGEITGGAPLSARKVNILLAEGGYQVKVGKGWEPTEMGKRLGAIMIDTGRIHSDGVPVRQLKWSSAIVKELRERM